MAIVRGYCDASGIIDYPLKKENGRMQESITIYNTIKKLLLFEPSNCVINSFFINPQGSCYIYFSHLKF